jgi:hypothetical protein
MVEATGPRSSSNETRAETDAVTASSDDCGEDDVDELEQRLAATLNRLHSNADLLRARDAGCDEATLKCQRWGRCATDKSRRAAEAAASEARAAAEKIDVAVWCAALVIELVNHVHAAHIQREALREAARIQRIEQLNLQDAERRETRRKELEAAAARQNAELRAAETASTDPLLSHLRAAAALRYQTEVEAAHKRDCDEIAELEAQIKMLSAKRNPSRRR